MRLNHRHSFNKKVFALFLAAAMAFEGSYAVPAYAQEAGKGMEESISSEAQAKESSSIMQDEAEWEEDALDGEQSEDTGTIEGLTDGTEEKPGEGAVEEGTRIQEEASEKEKTTAPGEGTEKEKTEIQGREPEKEEAAGSKKGEETADVEMEEEENEDAMEQNDSEEEGVGEDKEGVFNGIETLDEDSVLKAANASSGKCGKNLTWKLDGKGVLTISGQGEMEDYPNYYPEGRKTPWPEDSVKRIIIGKGVNNIGEGAFAECTNLTELKIAVGLDEIGDSSF